MLFSDPVRHNLRPQLPSDVQNVRLPQVHKLSPSLTGSLLPLPLWTLLQEDLLEELQDFIQHN